MYYKKFSVFLLFIIFCSSPALTTISHEDINLDPPVYPDDDSDSSIPDDESYVSSHPSQRESQDNRVDQLEEEIRLLKGEIENLKHQLKTKPNVSTEKRAEKEPAFPSDETVSDFESEDPAPSKEKTALQHYEEAQEYLSQQAYPEAERLLKDIIKDYPDSPLIINTRYWLGEIYYVQKDYKRAAIAFAEVYKSYRALKKDDTDASKPKIKGIKGRFSKVPEALLKLALSLKALDQTSQVCATLKQLHSEFPQISQTLEKRVEKLVQEVPQCKKEDHD